MSSIKAKISGVGMHVPEKALTNDDLSEFVETSDQWIRERTGIVERRIVSDGESNSDLSAAAIRNALRGTGCGPEDIDLGGDIL